ncbi:hypothetical protein AYX15_02604 [Cryptococcus neoformans]|nr:hypothetical protein AYX15_02604 [Cryptococcus neoformans var. grubii]
MSPIPSNLQDFTIKAANLTQAKQYSTEAYPIWGSDGQTYKEYWGAYQKECNLAPWGRDLFLTWVLVRKNDPDGEIYAGCKTYQRQAFVKHRNADTIEEGYIYAIACVLTPKKHLRKSSNYIISLSSYSYICNICFSGNGYATHFLSLLHGHLGDPKTLSSMPEPSGKEEPSRPSTSKITSRAPKALGSILWSDIGSRFYSRCLIGQGRSGWVVDDFLNGELIWKVKPSTGPLEDIFSLIFEEDLVSVGEELSLSAMEKLERSDTSKRSVFVPDPSSPGGLSFLPVKTLWKDPTGTPRPVGIRVKTSSSSCSTKSPFLKSSEDAIILFTISPPSTWDHLLVTYISNLSPSQLPSILRALDILATEAGQKEGCVWGLDLGSELVQTWKELPGREVRVGRKGEVDGHLLGVAWYGKEEDKGVCGDGQMWGWC